MNNWQNKSSDGKHENKPRQKNDKMFQVRFIPLLDGQLITMTNEIRLDAPEPRPGLKRVRITLSITPDEHESWCGAANSCGMKVTRWAPIALNRALIGIEPMPPKRGLPAPAKKGKVAK